MSSSSTPATTSNFSTKIDFITFLWMLDGIHTENGGPNEVIDLVGKDVGNPCNSDVFAPTGIGYSNSSASSGGCNSNAIENIDTLKKNGSEQVYWNDPSVALPKVPEPPRFNDYLMRKRIFDNGVKVLMGVSFCSAKDAELALKAVVMRAFSMLSAVHKEGSTTISYVCSAANNKGGENDLNPYNKAVRSSFEACVKPPREKCGWKAKINFFKEDNSFKVSKVCDPEMHCPSCFSKSANLSEDFISLASRYNREGEYPWFSTLTLNKLGISVKKSAISNHNSHKKGTLSKKSKGEMRKAFDTSDPINSDLLPEDKEFIGALIRYKEKEPELEFEYLAGDPKKDEDPSKLVYIGIIFPEQKEILREYGDLIFIDSTFGVNNRGHKAINLVVVDSHLKTLLAATAFVQSECGTFYERFLEFVRKSIPQPKRLPFCFIADSAHSIHSSIVKVFPYSRHIYCAFHLLKDKSLLGSANALGEEGRVEFRNLARRALVSHSLSVVESSVEKLRSIYLEKEASTNTNTNTNTNTTENTDITENNENTDITDNTDNTSTSFKKKVESIISHSLNGSRPLQDVYTADSIASSRVESINSIFKYNGMNSRTTLIGCFEILKNLIYIQQLQMFQNGMQNKKWKFLANTRFKDSITEEVLMGIPMEVLKLMCKEFVLSDGKYDVTLKGGQYIVAYKSDSKVYTPHPICRAENGVYYCSCAIRTGYPCRHMFAFVKNIGKKIELPMINSRFYLDKSKVNYDEVNTRAAAVIIKSIDTKNTKYGSLFKEKRFPDVSRSIKDKVDVKAYLVRDLTYFGDLKEPSQESASTAGNEFPETASTPEMNMEEEIEIAKFDLAASRKAMPDIPADIIESNGITEIVSAPIPIPSLSSPEKKKMSMSERDIFPTRVGYNQLVTQESEQLRKLDREKKITELTNQFYEARCNLPDDAIMALHAYFMHMSLGHFVELPEFVVSFAKGMGGIKSETKTMTNPSVSVDMELDDDDDDANPDGCAVVKAADIGGPLWEGAHGGEYMSTSNTNEEKAADEKTSSKKGKRKGKKKA